MTPSQSTAQLYSRINQHLYIELTNHIIKGIKNWIIDRDGINTDDCIKIWCNSHHIEPIKERHYCFSTELFEGKDTENIDNLIEKLQVLKKEGYEEVTIDAENVQRIIASKSTLEDTNDINSEFFHRIARGVQVYIDNMYDELEQRKKTTKRIKELEEELAKLRKQL